jgi:hypothetical protein
MKITKRIAKEVHNEKVKSYDEGFGKGIEQERKRFDVFVKKLKKKSFEIVHSSDEGTSCMIKVVSINQIDKLVGDMARIEITKEMLET